MQVSKSILTISSIAIAAMFGGGVYLLMNFGSIAKTMSERIASETLGVKVSIASVAVDFKDKAVTVSSVKVGNPPGYDGDYAATIEKIYLKAETLSQALLRFRDVTVTGTEVYLEVHPSATNLTDIKKTVDAKAAQGDRAAQQIKVIIENMRIEKMRVNPNVLLLSSANLEPIVVPDIVLSGIGVKENGVLARDVLAQIWADIAARVSREANKAGYYEGLSPEALEGVGISQIQNLKDQISNDVNDLGKNLRGLLAGEGE